MRRISLQGAGFVAARRWVATARGTAAVCAPVQQMKKAVGLTLVGRSPR